MARISKKAREEAIIAAIEDAVKDRFNALKEEAGEVATLVILSTIGKKNLEIMKSLPSEYFLSKATVSFDILNKDNSTSLRMLPSVLCKEYGRYYRGLHLTNNVRLPSAMALPKCYEYGVKLDKDKHSASIAKLQRVRYKSEEYIQDIEKLQATLESAFEACTTDAQLKEHYPDLVKYLNKDQKQTKGLVVTDESVKAAIACAASEKKKCK